MPKTNKTILVIIVIIMAIFLFKGKTTFFGGIVGVDCPYWKTNVNELSPPVYSHPYTWVATDCDGDGNYEAYGFLLTDEYPKRNIYITGQTPEGMDYFCNVGIHVWIYPDASNKRWILKMDSGAAPNADLSCESAPLNCEGVGGLKPTALSAIIAWASDPISTKKQTALNAILNWANSC